ncbi:DC-STAMP domain-containing protein 1-like [Sinocyclocheilus rhinocerous]|uniref:DC-STAMP domain-containing protein 1-like n=1 Tax=Sinocyclocheilus rhinocerous TaxID=307959 RepID=UPI0007B9CD7E|nr:PREDICTED: DC-STAMP domain-containing protein 1-like [Sinocyclocheilus rhinocerous]
MCCMDFTKAPLQTSSVMCRTWPPPWAVTDLQITHSKVMWRMLTEPYVQAVQEIVVVSLALFVCVLLAVDGILYNIFDLIRRHTFTTYSATSVHHIDIVIGGDSMLARLLRKTIGAFNTSSNLDVQSSNFRIHQSSVQGHHCLLLLQTVPFCLATLQ